MNYLLNNADFSFIKNGDMYIIEKDRYNALYPLIFLSGNDIQMLIHSRYKTIIRNERGEVIMQNFESKGKKAHDLTSVHELLTEVESAYTTKEKLLEGIDKALVEGNRELFIELTNQMKEVS